MAFWDFLRKKPREAEPDANLEGASPAQDDLSFQGRVRLDHAARRTVVPGDGVAALANAEQPNGPDTDEAVALLADMRRSVDEARAASALLPRALTGTLSSRLSCALAATLIDRGDRETAERVLQVSSGPVALVMLADLLEARSQLGAALALIERALLLDYDHPGARERHQRLRLALGLGKTRRNEGQRATTVSAQSDAPFRVLSEIARGGSGAVYEAEDRVLGRRLALKVYHQAERDRLQLTHEGRVASALEGAGIVQIFDADPEHGWIAYEWAQNGALRELLQAKRADILVPIERWLVPLASALAHCHSSGWVHHDIKPANVLFGRDGKPMLADFGIARRIGEPSPEGSLGYVSPERLAGRVSDPRDDIYGFGRILEDMLKNWPAVSTPALTALTAACLGPDATRPAHGQALETRLRIEHRHR